MGQSGRYRNHAPVGWLAGVASRAGVGGGCLAQGRCQQRQRDRGGARVETPDTFESTQGISTDSIGDDMLASTIRGLPDSSVVDDLDEEAIERSIAEINEAIRRSAARKA